jgi:DNA-binding response OmpR family regulator
MQPMVLVVENDLSLRELLRVHIEREGMLVHSTGSGAEAISITHNARPDLMLLDLRLSDVHGESFDINPRTTPAPASPA